MKRINFIIVATLLFGVVAAFTSCKKYEEGPLLSLKSKNGRITGEWELKEYNYTNTTDYGTITTTFNGSMVTTVFADTTSYTYPYSLEFQINKDGTYTSKEMADGNYVEETSLWSWKDGTSEKEMISFYSFGGWWVIKKLSNKELIIENNSSLSEIEFGDTYFSNMERSYTFEKK